VFVYSVPDDFKVNPGAVEAIAQHPTDATKVGPKTFPDMSTLPFVYSYVGDIYQVDISVVNYWHICCSSKTVL